MIINVDKPKDLTSRDVVNIICKALNTKKVGHTGTLDPIATGVLVICVGEATKLVEILTSNDKEYIAEIKLGIKTDTGDITGNIIETKSFNIKKENILIAFNKFLGDYEQTVPKYSAVKVNGKKLYEYARAAEEVELPKRIVSIKNIELIDYNEDVIKFRVLVSKGTYIRSLIEDICESLNTVGTMNNLTRSRQGIFDINDSCTLEDIKNNNFKFLTIKESLSNLPTMEIPTEYIDKVKNGAIIPKVFASNRVVLTNNSKIIAIYKTYEKNHDFAKPYRMFNQENT